MTLGTRTELTSIAGGVEFLRSISFPAQIRTTSDRGEHGARTRNILKYRGPSPHPVHKKGQILSQREGLDDLRQRHSQSTQ